MLFLFSATKSSRLNECKQLGYIDNLLKVFKLLKFILYRVVTPYREIFQEPPWCWCILFFRRITADPVWGWWFFIWFLFFFVHYSKRVFKLTDLARCYLLYLVGTWVHILMISMSLITIKLSRFSQFLPTSHYILKIVLFNFPVTHSDIYTSSLPLSLTFSFCFDEIPVFMLHWCVRCSYDRRTPARKKFFSWQAKILFVEIYINFFAILSPLPYWSLREIATFHILASY